MTIEYGKIRGGGIYRLVRDKGAVVSYTEYNSAWEQDCLPNEVKSLFDIKEL